MIKLSAREIKRVRKILGMDPWIVPDRGVEELVTSSLVGIMLVLRMRLADLGRQVLRQSLALLILLGLMSCAADPICSAQELELAAAPLVPISKLDYVIMDEAKRELARKQVRAIRECCRQGVECYDR